MKRADLSRFVLVFAAIAMAGASVSAQAPQKRNLALDDLAALKDVRDPQISPDGDWAAYVVRTSFLEDDRIAGDIWMARWDGSENVQLTHTKANESTPRWSPDGRYLAFLAARAEEDESDEEPKSQVWALHRAGGEARKLTDLPGGVSELAWSPDGKRLALIASDPEQKPEDSKKKTPPPIVIDRYQFKRDRDGYLEHRRDHLYLFELATEKVEILTPGDFDEARPSWSPDGTVIAFSSKREGDPDRNENWDIYLIDARPGATARKLTTFEGGDGDPSWGSAAAWSPDGQWIAYLQGLPPEHSFYDMPQLAVISAAGGESRLVAPDLDRPVGDVAWSSDGKELFFLFEDDRVRRLGHVPASGGAVKRVEAGTVVLGSLDLEAEGKMVAVASRPHQPNEIMAIEGTGLRALSSHNRELLEGITLGGVEGIELKSKDGAEVHGILVKPPGYEPGKRYPTIAYIHGGPVGQDGFEFDFTAQILAAHGYAVVQPNYRGSSGRGQEFSRSIYADWGNLEVRDVLAAIDHLVDQGVADPERLGIGGWSYGGMTTNYAIATDTRFKAAVSGAGVSNMLAAYGTDQYIRQYENEIGLPWKDIEPYLRISFPFYHADRIRTPTLFLCGEKDFNVPLINSEQMYQALRSLGVPTQLVIYPGQYHGLNKPGYLRDRLERYLAWFDKYLAPGGATSPTAQE